MGRALLSQAPAAHPSTGELCFHPTPPNARAPAVQLQVLLPKARPGWWKALSKGGQERSYHELLHEAVHAGGWAPFYGSGLRERGGGVVAGRGLV